MEHIQVFYVVGVKPLVTPKVNQYVRHFPLGLTEGVAPAFTEQPIKRDDVSGHTGVNVYKKKRCRTRKVKSS